MKLIILFVILFSCSNANKITNAYWTGSGSDKHKVNSIRCDNGSNVTINYYPNNISAKYFSASGIYPTLDKAINNSCLSNKKANKKYAKRGGLVCTSRKAIQHALTSTYNLARARIINEGCFGVTKTTELDIIKRYKREKTKIDKYVKVSDSYQILYIKSSDIIE